MGIDVGGNILSSSGFDSSGNIVNSPSIVTDGLVLWIDAGNLASYNNTSNYYDCGYGCQYYASDPGCTNCNTQLKDMSGYGYDGILVNGVAITYTNIGGSISFDGTNDYVSEYTIPDSFWNSGSWTVSAWCKFTSVNKGSDNAIVGHGYAAASNGLHLSERGNYVYFGFYGNDLPGTIPLSANVWYNIVYTFNYSSKLKQIYVNGTFDNSGGSVGYGGTGSNTEIGRYQWAQSHILYGNIGSIIFYNRVLTATEILQNFNEGRQRFGI